MLRTEGLHFSYNESTQFNFPNIACDKAETLVITGESGTGKTTLLHLLAGISKPRQGSISIDEKNIATLSEADLDRFRGRNISVIFQKMHFISSLSALDNVVLASYLASGNKNTSRAKDLMEQLQIIEQKNKYPSQLSLGQQQRLAIARALVHHPKVILADEPTSSLDDRNAEIVSDLLSQSAKENDAALIIVTHDMRLKSKFQNVLNLV